MSETPLQYRARLFSYIGDRDPLHLLEEAPRELADLLSSCPEPLLHATTNGGRWTIRQIAGHLADDALVLGYRIRRALADSGSAIEGFDQDRWAEVGRYDQIDARLSARRFADLRAWNLALVRSLSAEEWERWGQHSERGRESIRDMIALDAGHDVNHLRQVERIVRGDGR
jgi:hypothetical protein